MTKQRFDLFSQIALNIAVRRAGTGAEPVPEQNVYRPYCCFNCVSKAA